MVWNNVVVMEVLRNTSSTKYIQNIHILEFFEIRAIDGSIEGFIMKVEHDGLHVEYETKKGQLGLQTF